MKRNLGLLLLFALVTGSGSTYGRGGSYAEPEFEPRPQIEREYEPEPEAGPDNFPAFPDFHWFFDNFFDGKDYFSEANFAFPKFYNPAQDMICRFEQRFLKGYPFAQFNQQLGLTVPPRDMVVALDTSAKMTASEFQHVKDSLLLMVDNFCGGFAKVSAEHETNRFTLITSDGYARHYLATKEDVLRIRQDIHNMQPNSGRSCTASVLKKAYTMVNQYRDPHNVKTRKDVLIITDARSSCRTPLGYDAVQLRSVAHVSMVTIGSHVSSGITRKLQVAVSQSSSIDMYSFHSCQAFYDMMQNIKESPCQQKCLPVL